MLVAILVGTFLFLCIGYILYGRYLQKIFAIDDKNSTPAHQKKDGVDYVPSPSLVLLGHHFSSIAGAGPIVGPIIAGLSFGWLPALLWILLGSVFIGGVHDFSSLVASIRHEGKSLSEICKRYMNPLSYKLFLTFTWLALVYVITAFADLTAKTFVDDQGVACTSLLYIFLAIVFGYSLYRLKISLLVSTILSVILMLGAIVFGQYYPLSIDFLSNPLISIKQTWYLILILYCLVASVTPVWILLQPRDYLSSYLLYLSVGMATIGLLFGGFSVEYSSFIGWKTKELGYLFPMLFITVACGACSGFHSLVAAGTTSKQLSLETDAKKVGYGGMLIEGFVAVIALCTLMMLSKESASSLSDPLKIYSHGMGKFFSVIGISEKIGQSFGSLAIATFILTTLDTATRLGRYVFQEFFSLSNNRFSRYISTLLTLLLPIAFNFITISDKSGTQIPLWKAIWPVFGATNQLLAGLALLVIIVWLKVKKIPYTFVLFPAIFMMITTLVALVLLLTSNASVLIASIAMILLFLALLLLWQSIKIWKN